MVRLAVLALGFAVGWTARGTTGSTRSAALTMIAAALAALDRIKRKVAIEKDGLEDLFAEARARADGLAEERRARRRDSDGSTGAREPVDEAAA